MPYTSKQILTTALHAMQRTGWFKDGIRAWKARDPVDKMWKTFKTNFAKEYDNIKEDEALDNLPNAAMSGINTVEDLSKANKKLTEAKKQLTTQMEQIKNKLASITKLIEALPKT
eukprot:13533069-Ditylum_brightwellii.AAC.1